MDIEEGNDIVNNFSSDSEEENNSHNEHEIINEEVIADIIYDTNIYNFNFVYSYFKKIVF